MNRRALFLIAIWTLPGCSLIAPKPPDVIIREEPVPVVCDTTTKPDPIDTRDTPPTLVLNTQTEVWGFWFDPALYSALAENLQAMRRYMTQSRSIRTKLIACIDEHNASVEADSAGE